MFEELIQVIQDGAGSETVTVDGKSYITRELYLPPPEPQVTPIVLHTLFGFVSYVTQSGEVPASAKIVIEDPTTVCVLTEPTGRERRRECLAKAEAIVSGGFLFGDYMSIDRFLVTVQQNFVDGEDRAAMVKLVGTLRDEVVRTSADDGISQQVSVKAGVAREATAVVKNPWRLQQYRTFAELEQPEGSYILRLQRERDGLPKVALFEVVDNRWQLEAMGAILSYVKGGITNLPIFA